MYDVIIVGGGIAGCITVLSILRTNPDASILILDDAIPGRFKIGESLPAQGKSILQSLTPELSACLSQDTHIHCAGNLSAWASSALEESYALMNPYGMGWHLDRAAFEEELRQFLLNQLNSCSKLVKASFISIQLAEQGEWCVEAKEVSGSETRQYTSDRVVDASGRKSVVATKLGARKLKLDSLLAFYALFKPSSSIYEDDGDNDHHTLIEASQNGWWYTSQLPNSSRVVVYHTDDQSSVSPEIKRVRKPDEFLHLLNSQTSHIAKLVRRYGYEIQPGYPICTAANSAFLDPCCGILGGQNGVSGCGETKWYAVGDAAMAFDPLSSQGMITAMKVGMFIGTAIGKETLRGGDRDENDKHGDDDENILEMDQLLQLSQQVYTKYLSEKKYYYGLVGRFDGDFWKIRQGL